MNQFSINLLKLLNASSSKALISPVSLEIILQILLQGSKGDLKELVQQILENDKDAAVQLEELAAQLQFLKETNDTNTIHIQNLLLHIEALSLLPEFQEKVDKKLGLETYQGRLSAEKINAWSAEHTKGLIPNLGDIVLKKSKYKDFMLANTFYIKAGWAKVFDLHPLKTELFKLESGVEVETAFIEQYNETGNSNVSYFGTESFQAIQVPFKGDSLVMDIYLPNKHDGLPQLLKEIVSLSFVWDWDKKFELAPYINILLPKFELGGNVSLSKYAKELGLEELFGNTYDLANMFEPIEEPLVIEQFEQLTKLKIDENGIEGTSITYVMGGIGSYPIPLKCILFEANHPFLFVVKDKKSKSVLFLGTYGAPPKDPSFGALRQKIREFDKYKDGINELSIYGQLAILANVLEIKCRDAECLDNVFYKWYLEELWKFIETKEEGLDAIFLIGEESFLDYWETIYYPTNSYPMPDNFPQEVQEALHLLKTNRSYYCYEDIHLLSLCLQHIELGLNEPPVMNAMQGLLSQNLDIPLWDNFKVFKKDASLMGANIQRFQPKTLASHPTPLIKEWTEEERLKRSEYATLRQLKTLAWDFTIRGNVYFCTVCLLTYLKTRNCQSEVTDFLLGEVKLYLSTSSVEEMKAISNKITKIGDVDLLGMDVLDDVETKKIATKIELIKGTDFALYELITNLCSSLGIVKKLEQEDDPWDFSHTCPIACAGQLFEENIPIPNLEIFYQYLVIEEDLLGLPIEFGY